MRTVVRPPKGEAALPRRWTILRTEEQHNKVVNEWPDAADYVRTCIDTRYSGSVEEMSQRRDFIRKKVAELNLEAQELDNVIRTMEQDERIADFESIREVYERTGVYEREPEKQIGWLCATWDMTKQQAREFLAWVNADRSGVED